MANRKHKLKKISKGHYEYRGSKIDCIGYYPPEQRVCWECTYIDGSAFGHSYSLRDCIAEIDSEMEKESTSLRRSCEENVILTGSCLDNWCDGEAARFFPNNAGIIALNETGEETGK